MIREIWHRSWEDVALAFLLVVIGGFRVAMALAMGEVFGAEASLAAIALVLGLVVFPWRRTCST